MHFKIIKDFRKSQVKKNQIHHNQTNTIELIN